MSQLTGFRCVSQNCGWAAFHNRGKVQHQRCAPCCMFTGKIPQLLPPNPCPPQEGLVKRDAEQGGRPTSSACKLVTTSCCFVTCTNWPDHLEVGRITYPIPKHARIWRELKQRSTTSTTNTPFQKMRGREETQTRLKWENKIARTSLLVPGLNDSLGVYSRWVFFFLTTNVQNLTDCRQRAVVAGTQPSPGTGAMHTISAPASATSTPNPTSYLSTDKEAN